MLIYIYVQTNIYNVIRLIFFHLRFIIHAKTNFMRYENNSLHINTNEHRFEMDVEGRIAFIDYKQSGKKLYLVHTEVPSQLEGKGVGSALVQKTLQYIEEHHLQFVPYCPFVQSFLQKHPEWKRLEADEN